MVTPNPRHRRLLLPAAFAAVLLAAAGCGGDASTAPAPATSRPSAPATAPATEPHVLEPSEPFGRTMLVLTAPDGGAEISVPVYDAFDTGMRKRGLMHRDHLPDNAGMVFRFPDDRTGGFWMRNTLIPLSIAYFDAEGEVVTVLDMEPCTTVMCPSYPPDAAYRGALEVNQGYFDDIGLEPGWRVDLPSGLPPAT